MGNWTAQKTIFVGFILAFLGAALPYMILVGILPSTFLLNFLAYAASVAGLFLGVIGAAMYVKLKK